VFKETENDSKLDIFGSSSGILVGQSFKEFNCVKGWHNQFYNKTTKLIDETLLKVLFDSSMVTPNESISTLFRMMIFKDAFGCSDAIMYENSRFNLLVHRAIGISSLSGHLPAPYTYYLLRCNSIFTIRQTVCLANS